MTNAFDERMAALRARFIARAAADRAALAEAGQAGDDAEIRRIAHGLAGAAGTFGFPEVSAAALRVEEADDIRPMLEALFAALDQLR